MSMQMAKLLCRSILRIGNQQLIRTASTKRKPKVMTDGHCIISCNRSEFDFYNTTTYGKLDQVPLASKGWTHSKSRGDWFTIHPTPDQHLEDIIPFKVLGVDDKLTEVLAKKDIINATEFQAKALPSVTNSKHLIIAAETGCGKTITYLLPIIQYLMHNRSEELNAPKALVVVPNRELAYQVGEVAEELANAVGVKVKVLVGGRTKRLMMNPEFTETDILVATPGALGKLSSVGVYKLNEVLFTVFDEADTLLDDSFTDRMVSIIKRTSQSKIILTSATLPRKLPDALKHIEQNLQEITSPNLHKPLLKMTQKFLRLTRSAKPSHLLQICKNNKHPMLVFSNRNQTCNWLAMFLRENGVACSNINGDMNYAIRINQWNDFIRGNTNILSATDVGSRGLNTTQVQHVLNYDFPIYAADYLHRVGRVGRLGSSQSCRVTNFISGPEEVRLVQQIEVAIRKNQPLTNVDGNITKIVMKKMAKGLEETV